MSTMPSGSFDLESGVVAEVLAADASASRSSPQNVPRTSSAVAPWDEPTSPGGEEDELSRLKKPNNLLMGTLDKEVGIGKPQSAIIPPGKSVGQANNLRMHLDGPGSILLPDRAGKIAAPVFSIHPETIRLFAYFAFYVMVLLALFVTEVFVTEDISNSPLVQMFGYNNVCILWDYEPATSVIAMFYPLVEIPLVCYVVLNFVRVFESWKAGHLSNTKGTICFIMFPFELILVLWFRMIFVVKAFEDVEGHTLGFHGLMIALCLIATQNFLYHDALNKLAGPRWLSIGYLVILCCVTSFKMIVAWAIFGGTPLWSVATVAGQRAGHFLDITWMILGSVMPAWIAYKNRQITPAMVLSFATAPTGDL